MRFACQSGCTKCCEQPGFVYLTEDDIIRAAEFLGMTSEAFELAYVYRTRHQRRLRVGYHQPCPFLRTGGCSIHPAKPTQCRIFPFWPEFVDDQRKWAETAQWCPGIGQGELVQIDSVRQQTQEMREAFPRMYR